MKFYLTKAAQKAAESGSQTAVKTKKAQAEKKPSRKASEAIAPSVAVETPTPSRRAAMTEPTPVVPTVKASVKPGKQKKNTLAIGGVPRVDLLPLEVRAERRSAQNVRRTWFGVVGVALLVGIGIGSANLVAKTAQDDLAATQGETSTLLAQQKKYEAVKTVNSQVALIKAGQAVGGSTDIDYSSFLSKLQGTLPSDTTITSVTVDSATPIAAYAQSTAALQGVRIGTVTVTVTSPSLPQVPVLLNGLRTLPGFVDATPGSVTSDTGLFSANIVVHINQDAYSNRFTTKGK